MASQRASSTAGFLLLLASLAPPWAYAEPVEASTTTTTRAPAPATAPQCLWNPPGALSDRQRTSCPLAVDDKSSPDALAASPWVQPLSCHHAKAKPGRRGGTSPPGGEKIVRCAYSNHDFHGVGLSLATRAEVAANLVGLGALDPPEAAAGASREMLRRFRTGPVDGDDGEEGGPAYDVLDLPGKGKGVVARRKILQGEVFMVDYPLLLAETSALGEMPAGVRAAVAKIVFDGLPEAAKAKVLSLAKSTGGDEVLDVFSTNSCGVTMADGTAHLGLFPEVSRMNHACEPNAFYRFSPQTLMMEVTTYRDISPGEEININYAYLGMPHKERRQYLKESWGFDCTCPLCLADEATREESDARRMAIVKNRTAVASAQKAGQHAEAIEKASDIIKLCEEEGLLPLAPGFHETIANEYIKLGDWEAAQTSAEAALAGWLQYWGKDTPKAEKGEELLETIKNARSIKP